MDQFSDGFVEILAAEQTPTRKSWFQGTADAVRHGLRYFARAPHEHVLILSGDQLYRMDFGDMLATHLDGRGRRSRPADQPDVPRIDPRRRSGRVVSCMESRPAFRAGGSRCPARCAALARPGEGAIRVDGIFLLKKALAEL
jgi:hypothetical protein